MAHQQIHCHHQHIHPPLALQRTKILNIWNKYSHKRNWAATVPISTIHSCVCEGFIYSQDQSAYSAAGKYVDRSWEYINRSHTHECGNLYWGHAIPRKEIHKWDFRCSVRRGGQLITQSPVLSFGHFLRRSANPIGLSLPSSMIPWLSSFRQLTHTQGQILILKSNWDG